jgi:hypothetical protein
MVDGLLCGVANRVAKSIATGVADSIIVNSACCLSAQGMALPSKFESHTRLLFNIRSNSAPGFRKVWRWSSETLVSFAQKFVGFREKTTTIRTRYVADMVWILSITIRAGDNRTPYA